MKEIGPAQPAQLSFAQRLARRPDFHKMMQDMKDGKVNPRSLMNDWGFWARPNQLAPLVNPKSGIDDWTTWVLRAGRGFGKTKTGSGWVHGRAMAQPGRWIALIAKNPAEARDIMIEGPSGILRNCPNAERPLYEPSKRRITWKNGAWATVFSDEEPDQTRGFSGDTAWLDEFAKYKNAKDTWDNLSFGMRELSSDRPRKLITTTPRPISVMRDIENMASTVVVIGSSYENEDNLAQEWFEDLKRYAGTRTGRQEIDAEILDDMPGALWTRSLLEKCRCKREQGKLIGTLPDMQRVVVGVDPSGTSGQENDGNQVGIVCVGLGVDGKCYVFVDNTCSLSPAGWGRRVVETYNIHLGDLVVAEKNFGGAMVEHVIKTVDKTVPVKMVTASRGKAVRAEPVSSLYEADEVRHVEPFPEMEDQMCSFTHEGFQDEGSPDRVDALVWAITELKLRKRHDNNDTETGLPITR